tara:strand:- start:1097 stop:1288 length:192 start_codon:yes stop_codon:yes gene_type:complete
LRTGSSIGAGTSAALAKDDGREVLVLRRKKVANIGVSSLDRASVSFGGSMARFATLIEGTGDA